MTGNATPLRCAGLLRVARKLIESNGELFTKAGSQLAELYSEQHLIENAIEEKWDGKPAQELIFPRLDAARSALLHGDNRPGFTHLLFEEPMMREERKLAASMVVLILVLTMDPEANEYVPESMCPFAALPWYFGDEVPGLLGRCMFAWESSERNSVDCPPGEVLDLLERATGSARTGDVIEAWRTIPTGDVKPATAASSQSSTKERKTERRPGQWFAMATSGGVYSGLLFSAKDAERLCDAEQIGTRWHYSTSEVAGLYPQYRQMIEKGLSNEASAHS